MHRIAGWVQALRESSGQGLVEYALILSLIVIAAVVALGVLSGDINNLLSGTGAKL